MSRWSLYVGLAGVVCGLCLAAGCAGPGHSPLADVFTDPLGRDARNPLRQRLDESARRREAESPAEGADSLAAAAPEDHRTHTARRADETAGMGDGHDAATQELIDQELRDAAPQERAQLAADLRGLNAAVVRNILKVRRVARQFGRTPETPAEPGHSHVRPGAVAGAGESSDVELVAGHSPPPAPAAEGAAGASPGMPGVVPHDPHAHVPGRIPAADPGLGGVDPWGRATAFPVDPAAVSTLPPAPHHDPHLAGSAPSPPNPVELSPEAFTPEAFTEAPGSRRAFIQRPLADGQAAPSAALTQQSGFRGAPSGHHASQYGRLPGEPYPSAPPVPDYTAQGGDPFARPPVQIASNDTNQQIPGALSGGPSAGDPQDADWSGDLLQVITRMEASLRQTRYADLASAAEKSRFIERHVFLRMLYLMVGREERALAAIPDVPAADREFWQQVFWGLSSYFDSAVMPDEDYRAAQAVAQLRAAVERLQQKAQLELRNVAFCHKVSNFGSYERFERDEFRPGQPVLLYAELVNFTSRMNADGMYHTRLKSTVAFSRPGPDGEVVERLDFPATEDLCHSYRRDYFHSYEFAIPPRLALGPHVLTLTVEDELGNKVATYRLNFTVN
jgi:hypothetical protein